MNENEIIKQIATETTITSRKEVKDIIRAFMGCVREELKAGNKVVLKDIGTLQPVTSKARKGCNPRTGEKIDIPEKKTIKFKPSPNFIEQQRLKGEENMSKLNAFYNDWQRAEIVTSEFITPEDGQYNVAIEEVRYTETDRDGNPTDPTFVYTFTITEGACSGQRFRRYTTIRNERSASYFKGDLKKLGLPIPANPEDLPAIVQDARGLIVQVTVRTKNVNGKDYKDVYFDRLLGRMTAPQPRQQPPQGYAQQPRQYPPQSVPYSNAPQGYAQQPPQYAAQTFAPQNIQDDDIPF